MTRQEAKQALCGLGYSEDEAEESLDNARLCRGASPTAEPWQKVLAEYDGACEAMGRSGQER